LEQHNTGIPEMKIANLFEDIDILKIVQSLATRIISEDCGLEKIENQKLRGLINSKLSGRIEI
jgi:RecG-like helicase